jgi:hypothetical protein
MMEKNRFLEIIIREKRKSFFFLVTWMISVIVVVILFFVNIRYSAEISDKNEKLELVNQELLKARNELARQSNEISQVNDSLSIIIEGLAQLDLNLSKHSNDKILEARRFQEKYSNVRYKTLLRSYKAKREVKGQILNYLTDRRYLVSSNFDLQEPKDYLACRSTVFFYSPLTFYKALEIKTDLEKLTGIDFDLAVGDEFDLEEPDLKWAIYIHIIGND